MARNLYCRKGKYALPVQAIVNSIYSFLCMSARCSGSTPDSVAWAYSKLAAELGDSSPPDSFWIAGDAAHERKGGVLTPWSSVALREEEIGIYGDAFNF